jgi:ABC-type lipoprotein release transport system permease subunit
LLVTLGPVISQAFNITAPAATTTTGGPGNGQFGGGARALFAAPVAKLSNVHLTSATLNVQTLLIIVGLGMGLAVLTSVIPAWYVARIKPAEVLRRG